jgi:hypothetical protein
MEKININGKNYQVSFIDTEDTIKNMIAIDLDTFVNYIRFTVFNLPDKDLQIETVANDIKGKSLSDLKDIVSNLAKKWNISETDIACQWLHLNRNGVVNEYDYKLLDTFKEIDSTDFWSENAIRTRYNTFIDNLKHEQIRLKALVAKETKFRKEYTKYKAVDTTKFLQDSVIIEYQITIDLDPLEAFDNINLSADVPFVRLKNISGVNDQIYYKLMENIRPAKSWLEGDTTFTFKIPPLNINDKEEWNTATLNYTSNLAPYNAILIIESSVAKGGEPGTNEEQIKNSILGVFTGADVKIISRQERGIKGVFAIPDITISRMIFLDLITNEPLISHYFYVDETRELSSQKGVLYMYFSPGEITQSHIVTVFISEKTVSRSDPFYIEKELPLFTPYLNVRVSRALNLNQVNRFKDAFAVMLDIYQTKTESIINAYNKIIPGFKLANSLERHRVIIKGKRIKELQAQDSELFIYDYPTKCEKKKQPIPIIETHIQRWEEKKHQVMNYPKGSSNFFVCPEKALKFPGLLKNKLANSAKYAYLPCCYPVNQRVGRKKWNIYLKDIEKVSQSKIGNIVNKKAVGENKLGYLPKNIYCILNKTKQGEEFLRQGVDFSKNSFIATILLALDPNYEKITIVQDRMPYVQDVRNNLASQDITSVVQQMYDTDAKKIVKDILDPEVIFDSEIFIGLLEAYYDCQIIVFTRSEQEPNGYFEIPRYTQGYLYNKLVPGKNTVLVYKHMGVHGDNLEFPHYELIVMRYKKITTWYFTDLNLIRNIYSHFLRSYRLFIIGIGRYAPVLQPFPDAHGQVIDIYGKCRGFTFPPFERNPDGGPKTLLVGFSRKAVDDIYITTSPLTPIFNIIAVNEPKQRPAWNSVRTFIKKYNLTILEQDIDNNRAIGVTIDILGIPYAYIPFLPTKKLDGIAENKHLGYSISTKNDILQKTVENRKIADFLMQLLLYNFSLWYMDQQETSRYKKQLAKMEKLSLGLQQNKKRALLMNMVEKYLKEKITIIPDHKYKIKNLHRRLTLNNRFFKDDKLVVDSKETADRLGYYLRFMINKNNALVVRYSERIYLENYYTYSADFIHRSSQLIFIGGLSISNWIEAQRHEISNQTHTIPHPDIREPFFFTHWALNGGKPVIIQNVHNGSINRALSVSANYEKDGINIGYNADPIKELLHSTYYFKNNELIQDGVSKVKIWKFTKDFYGAILIP